jgi:hypothetical protein
VWIRGGAFDREYSVTMRGTFGEVTAKYKTPGANYPGELDTSGIPAYLASGSGDEAVSFPGTILQAPATSRLALPTYQAIFSNIVVKDSKGALLVRTTSEVPGSAGQFYFAAAPILGGQNYIVLYSGAVGEEFTVSFACEAVPFTVRWQETLTRTAELGASLGYVYLPSPLLSGSFPVTCIGYAHISTGYPGPGELLYNPTVSPDYAYFDASQIGNSVVVVGRRRTVVVNPDYQRLVDEAKLNHERLVTAYTLEAARKITPEYIAGALGGALQGMGLSVVIYGNHLALPAISVEASDGGDGTLVRAVDQEVPSVDALTDKHYIGKTVRIKPVSGADGYYVTATRKGTYEGTFGEVLWVEAAGTEHKIQHAFCYATVSGGSCYVASTAAKLATLLPGNHPDFPASTAGDSVTAPPPAFIGKKITLLTTFQNRLIVGTGGTLSISRTGDYLAFHPKSVLTVPADDAFEVTAQGSDTDVLRQSVLYGRDLLLFGDNRQYAISGKEALTPTGVSLSVVSTVPGAATCQPQAIGGYLFFANTGERGTAVSQLQPSLDPNNPQVLPVSEYLTSYLAGSPVEAAHRGNPDTLYLRTDGAQGSIFQYRFSDSQRGREHSAWNNQKGNSY